MWNCATGQEVTKLKGWNAISLAFSRDSKTLAIAHARGVALWDLEQPDARAVSELEMPADLRGLVGAAAFSADSRLLATGHYRVVLLWDIAGRPTIKGRIKDLNGIPASLAISEDGRIPVLEIRDKTTKLMVYRADALGDTPMELSMRDGIARAVAFAGGSKWLATGDRAVVVFDLTAPKPAEPSFTLETGLDSVHVCSLSISPNGKLVAAAASTEFAPNVKNPSRTCDWAWSTGKRRYTYDFPFTVFSVAFAPDGRHLALANQDGTICMLRLKLD